MKFVPNRKIWFASSGVLIGLSIAALAVWGLNLSIDFAGGSLLEVKFQDNQPSNPEIRELFEHLELPAPVAQPSGASAMVLRFPQIDEETHRQIIAGMEEQYGVIEEIRFGSIGPTVGRELFNRSIVAIIVVTIAVLLYIGWSFRGVSRPVPSWVYGTVVIITFAHDTIIPLGVFAWLGRFKGIEVGSPFIAAVLMILAYSINDTIVVFDRVRENLKRIKASFEEIVEASVHQTISRSINTSLTTILVLLAIYLFGGETLSVFALALIIGIALGTYSSIFIAAPLLVTWYFRRKNTK